MLTYRSPYPFPSGRHPLPVQDFPRSRNQTAERQVFEGWPWELAEQAKKAATAQEGVSQYIIRPVFVCLAAVAAVALLSWNAGPEQPATPTDQVPTKSIPVQWPTEPSCPVLVVAPPAPEPPLPLFATLPAVPDPRADLLAAAGAKIRQWEGVRRSVYTDPSGNKAVGIGCNLDTSTAPALLKGVGANYSRVRTGLDRLSTRQVEKIFMVQLESALDVVEGRIGQIIYTLPSAVQILLLDLSFNCGKKGFSKFRSVRWSATNDRYDRLPSLLKATHWYRQTGPRARDHIGAINEMVNTKKLSDIKDQP